MHNQKLGKMEEDKKTIGENVFTPDSVSEPSLYAMHEVPVLVKAGDVDEALRCLLTSEVFQCRAGAEGIAEA